MYCCSKAIVASSQAIIVDLACEMSRVRPPDRYRASNSLQPAKPLTREPSNRASA